MDGKPANQEASDDDAHEQKDRDLQARLHHWRVRINVGWTKCSPPVSPADGRSLTMARIIGALANKQEKHYGAPMDQANFLAGMLASSDVSMMRGST